MVNFDQLRMMVSMWILTHPKSTMHILCIVTSHFVHEYLWNGSRYQQEVNCNINHISSSIKEKNLVKFGAPITTVNVQNLTHLKLIIHVLCVLYMLTYLSLGHMT